MRTPVHSSVVSLVVVAAAFAACATPGPKSEPLDSSPVETGQSAPAAEDVAKGPAEPAPPRENPPVIEPGFEFVRTFDKCPDPRGAGEESIELGSGSAKTKPLQRFVPLAGADPAGRRERVGYSGGYLGSGKRVVLMRMGTTLVKRKPHLPLPADYTSRMAMVLVVEGKWRSDLHAQTRRLVDDGQLGKPCDVRALSRALVEVHAKRAALLYDYNESTNILPSGPFRHADGRVRFLQAWDFWEPDAPAPCKARLVLSLEFDQNFGDVELVGIQYDEALPPDHAYCTERVAAALGIGVDEVPAPGVPLTITPRLSPTQLIEFADPMP